TGADGHGLPRECEKRRTPNSAAIEKGGDYTSTPPNTHAIAILINRNGYNTVICAASIRADPAVRLNHYRILIRQPAKIRAPLQPGAAHPIFRSHCPMWIVQIALRRPYTFIVLALLLLLLGPLMILRTPTDIFPNIDIPVITVLPQYSGLPPEEMANRMVTGLERTGSILVNDLEHIESQSLAGVAVIKFFFQQG